MAKVYVMVNVETFYMDHFIDKGMIFSQDHSCSGSGSFPMRLL